MSIKVYLSPVFNEVVERNLYLESKGNDIKDIIEDIDRKYPGFKTGKIRGFLVIFIISSSAYPDELSKIVKDGNEIMILTLLVGG